MTPSKEALAGFQGRRLYGCSGRESKCVVVGSYAFPRYLRRLEPADTQPILHTSPSKPIAPGKIRSRARRAQLSKTRALCAPRWQRATALAREGRSRAWREPAPAPVGPDVVRDGCTSSVFRLRRGPRVRPLPWVEMKRDARLVIGSADFGRTSIGSQPPSRVPGVHLADPGLCAPRPRGSALAGPYRERARLDHALP